MPEHTLLRDTTFDTSTLEKEQDDLTLEINLFAKQIQGSIYKNDHVAQDQTEYEKSYKALTARYEKAKPQLDEVTSAIQDKHSRCQSGYYLDLLEHWDGSIQKYEARLWHSMVDHVTVYSKDDIRFTMKDGTEVQA